MEISDTDNHEVELHEIYITIDITELYVEIAEVYRKSKNGPGFVLITSVKASESETGSQQDIDTDFRRLEL